MTVEQLVSVLTEISADCRTIQKGVKPQTIAEKYDTVFVGKHYEEIATADLCHILSIRFGLEISACELNKLIPEACKLANLKCIAMKNQSDLNNPNPAAYIIKLL